MKYLTICLALLATVAAALNLNKISPLHLDARSIGARITGGEFAEKGQIPYQAALKINIGGYIALCGGTLISQSYVLTAAHCCVGADKIEVILGSIEIHNESEPNRISLTVSRRDMKIHEKWYGDMITNDICLLKLPSEVELSEHIQIAALPTDDSQDYLNKTVIASGWGRYSDHSPEISPGLKFIKTKVIKNQVCNALYFGLIRDTNICTSGAGGVSTCWGDSGGPLVLEATDETSTTLVGITSFGISIGCEIGWPPVFTRISKYLKWINTNMN